MKLSKLLPGGPKLSRRDKETLGQVGQVTAVVGVFLAAGFGVGAGTAILVQKIRTRDNDSISGEGDNWLGEDPIVAYAKQL